MRLDVLKHIVENDSDLIEAAVRRHDPAAALGVAKLLLGNGGDLNKLSAKQKFYWTSYIRPLLEDVPCEGVFGDAGTCTGNGIIDEDSLLMAYQEQSFLCQHCSYDKDRMRRPD